MCYYGVVKYSSWMIYSNLKKLAHNKFYFCYKLKLTQISFWSFRLIFFRQRVEAQYVNNFNFFSEIQI